MTIELRDITLVFHIDFPADLTPAKEFFHHEFKKVPQYKMFKFMSLAEHQTALMFTLHGNGGTLEVDNIRQYVEATVRKLVSKLFEQRFVFNSTKAQPEIQVAPQLPLPVLPIVAPEPLPIPVEADTTPT